MIKKNAIIIGASSGIGRALAQVLASVGYRVGITARRKDLLESLSREIATPTFIQQMDIADCTTAITQLHELIAQMGGVIDLIVINAGVSIPNTAFDLEPEQTTVAINVSGFVAMVHSAVRQFQRQGFGHLVAISSIAAFRGSAHSPAYNASKAFIVNYCAGLRHKFLQSPITITDIRPGFVDTPMVNTRQGVFWAASSEKAAWHIWQAIKEKKKVYYITHRWRWVVFISRLIPEWLYCRLYTMKYPLENRKSSEDHRT